MIFIFGPDEASAGRGDDKIVATYPDTGMFILCGPGEDEVVFNETPAAGTWSATTARTCTSSRRADAGR